MLYLYYIILLFELLTVTYNIIKFIVFKIKNKLTKKDNISQNYNFHINILIPCYKEIPIIKQTLKHFKILIETNNNINIYIITTEKEKHENFLSQTTYDYLVNLDIMKESNFHILNYPNAKGMMADQLNYAIDVILKESNFATDKIYFSIYNADSRPDSLTFEEISKKIVQNNFPKVIQQYSNYFLNFNKQHFIMKGFSIYQTAFEFRNGLINSLFSKNLYSHVVGHGLTIRADYIANLNGFNSNFWCEDIYLTGLLYNNNMQIIPLVSLDNAENPETLSVQITQNAVWYKTTFHHLSILKDIKKSYKLTLKGIMWFLHELRASFIWFFMPMFLIYTFIYPIIIKNYILLLFSICTYSIFVFVNYLMNLIVIDRKRFRKYILNYFSLCISILFTGIGPLYSFFLKEKIKTPRD